MVQNNDNGTPFISFLFHTIKLWISTCALKVLFCGELFGVKSREFILWESSSETGRKNQIYHQLPSLLLDLFDLPFVKTALITPLYILNLSASMNDFPVFKLVMVAMQVCVYCCILIFMICIHVCVYCYCILITMNTSFKES